MSNLISNLLNNNSIYTNSSSTSKVANVVSKAKAPKEQTENLNNVGAVYEKSQEVDSSKAPYTINKMTKEERASIVEQLKADQAYRQQQLTDIVAKSLGGQVKTFNMASDDFWGMFADGKVTVDAVAKAKAQEDISEDGYWGVKQTSERLFDFASALAGDDVDMMKDMQKAMEKGYGQATKAWGKELPDISRDTIDAANKLFEEYYASKEEVA